MRALNRIVVHAAYTPPSMDIGAHEIRRWHVQERGWDDIGYHFVIRRDGTIEYGRPVSLPGAHVKGHNMDSLGICLVGGKSRKGKPEDNFRPAQKNTLRGLLLALRMVFGEMEVLGHRDLDPSRACPCFDVKAWF